jgi:hypothetical protein
MRREEIRPGLAFLAWFAIIAVVAACSGGAATGPGGSTGPGGAATQAITSPTVAPITMTATEETDRAAQGMVTLEAGGTIAAMASDGSSFELVVPPGAVAGDVTITMTPLRDVTGLRAGPVHAVRMEPDGLEFFQLARLTVRPPAPIPVEQQLLLIASGDGTDIGLALIDPASPADAPVLLLEHFTDGVVAQATPEQQALFKKRSAENADRRITEKVRERLQDERERRENDDDEAPADLTDLLEEYQREVLDKLKKAVALSCDHLYLYMKKLLSFERQVQLLNAAVKGSYAATVTEAYRVLGERYPECERQAIKKCAAAKDPQILITFWLTNTEVGYQVNVPAPEAMKARAQQRCRPEGYQFHFAGTGTGDYGYAAPIEFEYWGLLCPKTDVWNVWEMVDHEQGRESTGTPDGATYGPILVTFDGAGRMSGATYGPFGALPSGYLLHRTSLSLAPPEAPTSVTAQINAGQVDVVVTEPVEPWDGSFGKCEGTG